MTQTAEVIKNAEYRIRPNGQLRWVYILYRVHPDGMMEWREKDNWRSKWTVFKEIPKGAEITQYPK